MYWKSIAQTSKPKADKDDIIEIVAEDDLEDDELEEIAEADADGADSIYERAKQKRQQKPTAPLRKLVEEQEKRISLLESEIAELKDLLDKHVIPNSTGIVQVLVYPERSGRRNDRITQTT